MLTLITSIIGEASEHDHGRRLIGAEPLREPRRRFAGHNRTSRKCVIAGDLWIGLGRDEHT